MTEPATSANTDIGTDIDTNTVADVVINTGVAMGVSAKDKLEIIDKILQMYPGLKKERHTMIDAIIGGRKKDDGLSNEIVVERFEYNGQVLYRNKSGAIIDKDTKLVGVYTYKHNNNNDESMYKYYMFKNNNASTDKNLAVPPYVFE
jgi:hypothetical protein